MIGDKINVDYDAYVALVNERDRLSDIVDDLKHSLDHPVECPGCHCCFLPYIEPRNLR